MRQPEQGRIDLRLPIRFEQAVSDLLKVKPLTEQKKAKPRQKVRSERQPK